VQGLTLFRCCTCADVVPAPVQSLCWWSTLTLAQPLQSLEQAKWPSPHTHSSHLQEEEQEKACTRWGLGCVSAAAASCPLAAATAAAPAAAANFGHNYPTAGPQGG